jgi:uncharacterized repeat protein (TIGR04052 family)
VLCSILHPPISACKYAGTYEYNCVVTTSLTTLQKLLLVGSLGIILAFSAWRLSLFESLSFLTRPEAISAEKTVVQFRFNTVRPSVGGPLVVKDLRFYVHDLQFLGSDGLVFPIRINNTGSANASEGEHGVALIDLSRKTSADLLAGVSPSALSANIHAVAFKLGVAFAQNHANPLTARSPLNESEMYWVWQQGYKFFKLDLAASSGGGISFHLGSAGCESASALRPPSAECRYPNRVPVVLEVSDIEQVVIQVNPWAIMQAMQNQGVDLCSAAANFTEECASALALFGIGSESYQCNSDCPVQQVFSAGTQADEDG